MQAAGIVTGCRGPHRVMHPGCCYYPPISKVTEVGGETKPWTRRLTLRLLYAYNYTSHQPGGHLLAFNSYLYLIINTFVWFKEHFEASENIHWFSEIPLILKMCFNPIDETEGSSDTKGGPVRLNTMTKISQNSNQRGSSQGLQVWTFALLLVALFREAVRLVSLRTRLQSNLG